jgi:protein SCO1/2
MTTQDAPPTRDGRSRKGFPTTTFIILIVAGLGLGLLVGWLTSRFLSGTFNIGSYTYHGTLFDPPVELADFSLTGVGDKKVQLSDFRGKVVLLYFGYTYCPDVCPATMNELASAMEKLKRGDREQVQVLMVSVDPERDTPEAQADFLAHFDPTFLGLTGSDEMISAAAEPFGVYYQKQPGTVNSGYLVDHTASVFALNKDGELRVVYSFNTPGEEIAADLRRLVDQ